MQSHDDNPPLTKVSDKSYDRPFLPHHPTFDIRLKILRKPFQIFPNTL
jgi:hypothetical protein